MLRNKIIYLMLAVYSMVFAVLYNEYITAVFVAVILCLPPVLGILLLAASAFVTCELCPGSPMVTRGENIILSVRIKNKSVLPLTFVTLYVTCSQNRSREKKKLSLALDGSSEQIVHCHIQAHQCGIMTFSCDKARIYDYLRLFSVRRKVRQRAKIIVLPELYEIEDEFIPNPFAVTGDSGIFSKNKPGDDPSEVFDIREYRDGDRMHRIHWKLSSKKDRYMVKEFSEPVNCSVNILVDLYGQGADGVYADAVYEAAASLSAYLLTAGILHSVIWFDGKQQECAVVQVDNWEQIYPVLEGIYTSAAGEDKLALLKAYEERYEGEKTADVFYVGKNEAGDVEAYIKPARESRLHMIYLGNNKEMTGSSYTKIAWMDTGNMEASLKRMVF